MRVKDFKIGYIAFILLIFLTGFEIISQVVYRPNVHGLEGRYFTNLEWQGSPALVSLDTELFNKTLEMQREKFPENRYSVEWTGFIDIPETATYTFFLESDDGSWLWINDTLVVDNGGVHGLQEREGTLDLRKGLFPITLRYFQVGGYAVLRMSWKRNEDEKRPLHPVYLFPPSISRFYRIGRAYFLYLIVFATGLLVIAGDSLFKREEEDTF